MNIPFNQIRHLPDEQRRDFFHRVILAQDTAFNTSRSHADANWKQRALSSYILKDAQSGKFVLDFRMEVLESYSDLLCRISNQSTSHLHERFLKSTYYLGTAFSKLIGMYLPLFIEARMPKEVEPGTKQSAETLGALDLAETIELAYSVAQTAYTEGQLQREKPGMQNLIARSYLAQAFNTISHIGVSGLDAFSSFFRMLFAFSEYVSSDYLLQVLTDCNINLALALFRSQHPKSKAPVHWKAGVSDRDTLKALVAKHLPKGEIPEAFEMLKHLNVEFI